MNYYDSNYLKNYLKKILRSDKKAKQQVLFAKEYRSHINWDTIEKYYPMYGFGRVFKMFLNSLYNNAFVSQTEIAIDFLSITHLEQKQYFQDRLEAINYSFGDYDQLICIKEPLYHIWLCVWAGEQLHRIMNNIDYRNSNTFQPSEEQMAEFSRVFGDFWKTLTAKERQSILTKEQMFTGPKRNFFYQDQKLRAESIIDDFAKNTKIDHIFLLDGHGSITYCVWEAYLKRKELESRKLTIVVIDMDESVHQWHTMFFGKDMKCLFGNLYDMSDIFENQQFYEKSIYYFNFCGIGGKINTLVPYRYIENTYLYKVDNSTLYTDISWIKDVPSNIQVRCRGNESSVTTDELCKYTKCTPEYLSESLCITAGQMGIYPSQNLSDIPLLLHKILKKVPVDNFASPLLMLEMITRFTNTHKNYIIYLSYALRGNGYDRKVLERYIINNCNATKVTDRKDFYTYRLIGVTTKRHYKKRVSSSTEPEKVTQSKKRMSFEPLVESETRFIGVNEEESTIKGKKKYKKRKTEVDKLMIYKKSVTDELNEIDWRIEWDVGDFVCVDLTYIKGFEKHKFCHVNGNIEKILRNDKYAVRLQEEQKRRVIVDRSDMNTQRRAEPNKDWKIGDKVQVLDTLGGGVGWWDATVVGKFGKSWKVEWIGCYKDCGEKAIVSSKNLRSYKQTN